MAVKIGLISDLHATPTPVAQALDIFERKQVDHILCAGDIAGYGAQLAETVRLITNAECHCIAGNHEAWWAKRQGHTTNSDVQTFSLSAEEAFLLQLPRYLQFTFEGQRLYLVHASPPDSLLDGIKLLDLDGVIIDEQYRYWGKQLKDKSFEILVVGHTHQVFAETIGGKWVINPGSTLFNHSCAIITLPDRTIEWFSLEGKAIKKSWNWGMVANAPG